MRNKKTYFILAIVILVSLVVVIILRLFLPQKTKEQELMIISTIPNNNAIFVSTKAEIVFNLNRVLLQEEGLKLKVQPSPTIISEITYLENKIRILPKEPLKHDQKYEIKLVFKDKEIYNLKFETTPFTDEQIKEEGDLQTQGDLDFTEAYKEFLKNYPWYQKLPIETFEYRIVYDFETSSFRIRFRIKPQSEEQKTAIIDRALESLKKIGVKEPIKYYTIE